jgi:hypothetical protein
MLDNCTYNRAKVMHELSKICWFIEKHALADAQKAGKNEDLEFLKKLSNDLSKYINTMDDCVCSCE